MSKINLNEFVQEGAFKEALKIFNKQKEQIQDYILERSSIVPVEDLVTLTKKHKVAEEIARVIFVMELEYGINNKLAANYYKYELGRLEKATFALPNIYSFLLRFSLEEGFWIKYLTVDLPKRLHLKITKLLTLDRSLFGKLHGSKEDSALYIMERLFLIDTIIKPILFTWLKDHQAASCYDAASSFLCSIRGKAMEKAPEIVGELCNRFTANITAIKEIILALDSKGWAGKAITQYQQIETEIRNCKRNLKEMGWRIASELVLEATILMAYEQLEMAEGTILFKNNTINRPEEKVTSSVLEQKREDMVQDKLTQILLAFDNIPKEKRPEILAELIEEYYRKAFLIKHQKPSTFGKEFLKELVDLLEIDSLKAKKLLKTFDSQLMYRLSPQGAKEFPSKSVDEKVLSLLKEMVIQIIESSASYQEILERKQSEKQFLNEKTAASSGRRTKVTQKPQEEETLGAKIKNASEKDLWYLIRDLYLNELFNEDDELLASARVLKKSSLELGLLLTESEAVMILSQGLEQKKIDSAIVDKETLDKALCKIIWEQLKEQLAYQ